MKYFITLLLLTHSLAQAQTAWKPAKASVTFTIRNAGLSVDGSFGGFMGELLFDSKAPEKSQITASVDASTIDTGIKLRNNHLRKAEYFDIANHPRITLKSAKLARQTGNTYEGTFALTLKGTTRTVTVPFTMVESGNAATFSGQFTINRLDYKVGGKSLLMSNDVTISLTVQATR
ncbi:MAG: YceI family protein [Cytophagales bacterium]|nr:MAG: YceI family protein [Cytophagales bacterium]